MMGPRMAFAPIHPASPAARSEVVLGVIGGSGLYELDLLQNIQTVRITTPFGEPSGAYICGEIARKSLPAIRIVFLSRHGPGHVLSPSEINYRANVHGLKQLGVTHVLSISAVGSLREEITPGDLVLPDQLLDRTHGRAGSFFEQGVVAHIQMGDPFCAQLQAYMRQAAHAEQATIHEGGTCVVIQGPAFSTRAESNLYRSWGASIIGMTALPEVKLVREAEMASLMLALSTDYDCWHISQEEVNVESVIAVMNENIALAKAILCRFAALLPLTTAELPYPQSLKHALTTAKQAISPAAKERLDLLIGHYL